MAKVVANLLRKGIAGPLALYVSPDAKNSVQYTVYATQAGTTLPDRDYYLADDSQYVEARRAFEEYMVDMLTAFGVADDARGCPLHSGIGDPAGRDPMDASRESRSQCDLQQTLAL